ncbi:SPOR domain-containing protein [Deltaproteobacteria bacterium TL4]
MHTPKKQKAYRIQLSVSQLLILGILGGCCLVVSFYLGLVTGKSLRNPLENVSISQKVSSSPEESLNVEDLKFFDLGDPTVKTEIDLPKLEKLKEKTQNLTDQTESLPPKEELLLQKTSTISEDSEERETSSSEQPKPQLSMENKPASSTPPKEEKPPKLQSLATTSPEKQTPETHTLSADENYTVQVFSSKKRASSEGILKLLKQKGYSEAFIHTYVSTNNEVLYRVRVGRMNQAKASVLAIQLKKLQFVDSVQVTRM